MTQKEWKEAFSIIKKAIKERGILRTAWGIFLVFAFTPLSWINCIAEAYSNWFNNWNIRTFGW